MFRNIGEIVLLFWSTLKALPLVWRQRQKVVEQFFEIGNASLLMVCVLSFFIGGVLALETGPVLVERGLSNAVGGLVGYSIARDLAPIMMAILISGRIGSAMAAEIGSMRVYQEIDALRTMSINPVHYLVLPRMVAIVIALPMLVVVSIMVGWTGGALVASANASIAIPFAAFFADLRDVVEFKDLCHGVFKSFCFANIIGIVSCHQGLITGGGPRGIGRSVTKAVVNSIVLIIIFDYIITRIISKLMSATDNNQQGVSVEVRGLRKSYNGQEVLKGVDFSVKPGEIFVIMGPSGSGKSVLLRHVIGLEPPDEGDILINDAPVEPPDVTSKYRMALVFQSGALLNSLNVGENVGLYLTEHRLKSPEEVARIVAESLEVVGLKGAEAKMPSELSGGMKKRAALARALVIEPQLILYDEPTSELDPLSAVMIGDEILKLNERIHVTSIVVSHDRDLAFGIGDRIAVINEGKIIAIGPPEEIGRSTDPVIRKFLHADLKPKHKT